MLPIHLNRVDGKSVAGRLPARCANRNQEFSSVLAKEPNAWYTHPVFAFG